MFRNYLVIAVNNLLKNKLFSFINIAGLSIGLAACILIGLYVRNETSYDRHWTDVERLYRLDTTIDRTGSNPQRVGVNAYVALPALKRDFNEAIEYGAHVMATDATEIRIGDETFSESIAQVDRDLLEIFDFEVLAGSLEATLEAPGRIALSEELALRYFGGNAEALGQTLQLTAGSALAVTAVYRFPERNTVLVLPSMTLLEESRFPYLNNWMILATQDYIKIRPGTNVADIAARLEDFTNRNVNIAQLQAGPGVEPADRVQFRFENISDVYLGAPSQVSGSMPMVLAFSAISLLVLLIGSCNFTILSTAKATQRAREVALRKVNGACRGELILQFLGESFMLVLLATVLALALVEVALPLFESIVRRDLALDFGDPVITLGLAFLLLLVTLTGGLYPAFVLSSFRPAATLKANRSSEASGSLRLRSALVVFQFAISIALMIATAVIWLQVQYVAGRDPGFDRENLLVINNLTTRPDVAMRKMVLRERLAAEPGVVAASLSGHQPMQRVGLSTVVIGYTLGTGGGEAVQLPTLSVDYAFMDAYRIPLVAGRDFDETVDQPARFFDFTIVDPTVINEARALVNVTAARNLGFADPQEAIGAQLSGGSGFNRTRQVFTIIGVVGNTQFFSLRTEPRAELYIPEPNSTNVLTLRYEGNPQELLRRVKSIWREVMGDATLFTAFVDQLIAPEFAREQTEARMLISFSLLAIAIACLGLFGSASFNVERRTKEIGIRKVLGAEVRQIVTLMLWQFSKPVLLANVIAWPVALWAMLRWLQRFPYQIDSVVLVPLCILAGAIALSIAWLTVAGNTVRVATTKPVLALRYE